MNNSDYFIEKYYPTAGFFERKFDAIKAQMGFKAKTIDEFNVWKQAVTYELKQLTKSNTLAKEMAYGRIMQLEACY